MKRKSMRWDALSALLPLCGGNTPVTNVFPQKPSHAKLWCFLWCLPEQAVDQILQLSVICDAMTLTMMTSSNGNIFRVTVPRYWEIHRSPVNSPRKGQCGEFPAQGAVTRICVLNKRLSKQSWGWWFETPPRSLWRNCNACHRCSGTK